MYLRLKFQNPISVTYEDIVRVHCPRNVGQMVKPSGQCVARKGGSDRWSGGVTSSSRHSRDKPIKCQSLKFWHQVPYGSVAHL